MHDSALRAPLLVRHPPVVKAASQVDALVSSVDVAPTRLEFAGAKVGEQIQGTSYAPLLTASRFRTKGRQSVLIENFSDDRPLPWVLDADYKAIRTDRHELIHWIQHPELDELYDLSADPKAERNLISDHAHRDLVHKLRFELGKLVKQSISL